MRKSPIEILRQLQSHDSRDRTVALVLIGRSRMFDAVEQVINVMQLDGDRDVRAMAAWTLDLLGSPETVPVLIQALYDPYFGVRSNAGWGLVHLARRYLPELVVSDVIDVLKHEDNADARQMAYLVLMHIGGKEANEAIRTYWK